SMPACGARKLIWLGVVGNTLYQLLFATGLSITTAANSALFVAATPVVVALLGALSGVERPTRNVVAGVALAFIGITLVLAARGVALSSETLSGDLLVLVAAVCWSVYTLGVRSLGGPISSLRVTALTMLTGTPGLVLAGAPQLLRTEWGGVSAAAWGGLAYATLFALVVAYVLWNVSVRRVGSNRTAVYSCVTPLVAAAVAWPVLGEWPVPLQGVGAALIVAGVLLTGRRSESKKDEEDVTAVDEEIHATA
ncbi:MAG: DMT family transporter, partial [Pyrinomonadaceae bacterium]